MIQRPLSPKAVTQVARNQVNRRAENGHQRTSANPQKYISPSALLVFVDTVVSIVGQMEDDVNKRSRRFLTFLLCAAFAAIAACSTTPAYTPVGEGAIHGMTKGDRVPVRWSANGNSEVIRITSVSYTGITGIGEDGRSVSAEYDELYEIGYKPVMERSYESLSKFEKALGKAIFLPLDRVW